MFILMIVDVDYAVAWPSWVVLSPRSNLLNTGKISSSAESTEEFPSKVVARTKTLPFRRPLETGRRILGPLGHQGAGISGTSDVTTKRLRFGATLHAGGTHEGLVLQPTILTDVPTRRPVSNEETFGTAVIVGPVETPEDASPSEQRPIRNSRPPSWPATPTGPRAAPKILHGHRQCQSPNVNDDDPFARWGGVRNRGWGRKWPDQRR